MKALLATFIGLFALAAFALTENFDLETGPKLPDGWSVIGQEWTVKGGALWKNGPGDRRFAIWDRAGSGTSITVEANVMVRRRDGKGWGVAGIAIRQNVSNLWHLAFVEAPPDKGGALYVELLELLDGVRMAQSNEITKLKCIIKEGSQFPWEMNKAYRFRLVMGGGKIMGTVSEPDGRVCASIGYEFTNRAVTNGTPAFTVSNFVTVFDDLKADVAPSQ